MSNIAIFPREPNEDAAPLAPASSPADRRGPLRPERLIASRRRLNPAGLAAGFKAADGLAVGLVAAAVAHLVVPGGLSAGALAQMSPFIAATLVLIWSLRRLHVYAFRRREGVVLHFARVLAAFALAALVVFLIGRLLSVWEDWRRLLAFAWRIGLATVLSLHGFWWLLVRYWRRQGRLTPNIVIVGANDAAARLVRAALRSREVAVLGVFDDRLSRAPHSIEGVPVLGDSEALLQHHILPSVDRIVVAVSQDARHRVGELVERLSAAPNEVCLIMDLDPAPDPAAFSRIADMTLTRVSGPAMDASKAFSKRLQDLVIGAVALAIAAPAMLLIALAIKLDSPGPVFFRQRRHGFNNEEILIWKFRSMRHEPQAAEAPLRQACADDERVTEVGRLLRGKSLDELPQLFNVLRGEMSLVGPRPHAIGMRTGDTDSALLVARYAHRNRIKPGMTGWAAVNGSRGPVDTPELVRRRVALDIEYIERQSFWMDLRIMAATIPCLLGDPSMVR